MDVVAKTKELNLPADELVIVAGGAMAARGLKKTNDVDLVVSQWVYDQLKEQGWAETIASPEMRYLSRDPYEVMTDWDSSDGKPNLNELRADSELIDGIAVVSLIRVLEWKRKKNRAKDPADIKLIEAYLNQASKKSSNAPQGE